MPLSRVPKRRFYGEAMQNMMVSLLMEGKQGNEVLDQQGWQGRRVLGFKLPEWQREPAWNDDQCAAFIKSIYMGANIGQYMVNQSMQPMLDRILIDGQQRLHAIERYVAGDIGVQGEWVMAPGEAEPTAEDIAQASELSYWPDLKQEQKVHFLRIPVPYLLTRYENEATLREAYNIHNFGGTPHKPSERAPDAGDMFQAPVMIPR